MDSVEQRAVVQVPAGAVAVAISHITVGARVLDGTPPREAFNQSYDHFFTVLAPQLTAGRELPAGAARAAAGLSTRTMARATALIPELAGADITAVEGQVASAVTAAFPCQQPGFAWLRDRYGGLAPRPPGKDGRWTTACFIRACQQNEQALRMTREQYAKATSWPDPPMTGLSPGDRDRLAWMMNMMRIYASGGGGRDLRQCARIAADHAAGRPRHKRAPADRAWLAAELAAALHAAAIAFKLRR